MPVGPFEGGLGFFAGEFSAGAVGGGREGGFGAAAADDVGRVGHGAGDDAEDSSAGGSSAFAVDDHFLSVVDFLPREVVVVFDLGEGLDSQLGEDLAVDDVVIGLGEVAHEV